ncbi:hypothetical protein NAF17_17040 [Mucilaginibacter sp. RB4R14]|uniref:hypothetical protein n=1 Tax=Mucilaginibacter aurantiaciroseus TaxID=2949308 RepID=UPI002091DECA|nr:hypothetical protein [Mucilaginibacter aurantiaciroseus]MCO5937255.1 hypothetical protein [Mucilaginibacter aurantiaciroseus]
MKGIKGLKSSMYIKSNIGAIRQKIAFNSKLINNLVQTNGLQPQTQLNKGFFYLVLKKGAARGARSLFFAL